MKKQPLLSVLLSFVLPGLGQIYNEDVKKGVYIIIGSAIGFFFFGLGYLALWLWAIVDAYLRARAINQKHEYV